MIVTVILNIASGEKEDENRHFKSRSEKKLTNKMFARLNRKRGKDVKMIQNYKKW